MATWYGAHIAQAANSEGGPDGEALVLELWELLAREGPTWGAWGGGDAFTRNAVAPAPARAARGPRLIQDRARSRAAPRLDYYVNGIGAGANPALRRPFSKGCRLQRVKA